MQHTKSVYSLPYFEQNIKVDNLLCSCQSAQNPREQFFSSFLSFLYCKNTKLLVCVCVTAQELIMVFSLIPIYEHYTPPPRAGGA